MSTASSVDSAPGQGAKGKGGAKKAAKGKPRNEALPVLPSMCTTASSNGGAEPLPVLVLIDTAGCGCDEQQEIDGSSYSNPGEARAVMTHVRLLVQRGVAPHNIGIITPYNAQVRSAWFAFA